MAVIESIIFLLKTCLDELNQRLADLSCLPVYRPMDCEATARGTAYLLCDQPTHWPEEDAGIWYKPAENIELRKRYEKWMDLMLENMREI